MARYPCDATKNACSSHASAFSGQPWLNTTGFPAPRSLQKICVLSRVVMVPIGFLLHLSGRQPGIVGWSDWLA